MSLFARLDKLATQVRGGRGGGGPLHVSTFSTLPHKLQLPVEQLPQVLQGFGQVPQPVRQLLVSRTQKTSKGQHNRQVCFFFIFIYSTASKLQSTHLSACSFQVKIMLVNTG